MARSCWQGKSKVGVAEEKEIPTSIKGQKLISLYEQAKAIETKVIVLRILVVLSLIAACIACGYIGFQVIHQSQVKLFKSQYKSTVNNMSGALVRNIGAKVAAGVTLTKVFGLNCPNKADWPNCILPRESFLGLTSIIADVADSTSFGYFPLVPIEEGVAYEEFIYGVFANDSYPDKYGYSGFGKGIFACPNDVQFGEPGCTHWNRVHDIYGNSSRCGHPDYVSPLVMFSSGNFSIAMVNVFSVCDRSTVLNSLMQCNTVTPGKCTNGMTNFLVQLCCPEWGPSSISLNSIYPDNYSSEIVGFISTVFAWSHTLQSIVPEFVTGINCIISSNDQSFEYSIVDGEVRLQDTVSKRKGSEFDDLWTEKQVLIESVGNTSAYYIQFYPTKAYYKQYTNQTPYIVSFGAVAIIVFTSIVFLLYDFVVKQEVIQRQLILDSKRVFVRFISHEIRTPMNVVCLGLKLLEDELKLVKVAETSESRFKECLTLIEEMHHSSDTAVVVLNDLINYDKIEMNTLVIERNPLPIWNLVTMTVRPMIVQAKARNIRLVVDLEVTSSMNAQRQHEMQRLLVLGDDIKLGQVIRNLVSNALKFSPDGSDVVVMARWLKGGLPNYVCALNNYRSNGSIEIKVRDFGPGLSVENQKSLFREGIQFNPNQLQGGQGSGLGLWISKGIIEQHGGTIGVQSELGNGSTFIVELPLIAKIQPREAQTTLADDVENQMPVSSVDADPLESSNPFKLIKRVLLVDDAPTNRKILSRLLRNEGFVCEEAENGEQCIEKVLATTSESSYDLILMDYEMPVMNGPDATMKLRDLGCKIVIFGVTGNVLPDDVKYFMSHGADNVLSKPVSIQMLQNAYNSIMKSTA